MMYQQVRKLVGRDWGAEVEPLRFVTLLLLQKVQLFFCFYTLGDYPKFETSAHADDCAHDTCVARDRGDLPDEHLIDLEGIKRKFPNIT